MKTFESEIEELSEWLLEKTNIYFEKTEKEQPTGHDSESNYERAQNIKEYNRRLAELNKKYNKTAAAQDSNLSKKSERVRNGVSLRI